MVKAHVETLNNVLGDETKNSVITKSGGNMSASIYGPGGGNPSLSTGGSCHLGNSSAPRSGKKRDLSSGTSEVRGNISDGKFTTSRAGVQLCRAYNGGECQVTVGGNRCPNGDRLHLCDQCLGGHPARPKDDSPCPNGLAKGGGRDRKGKGRGKGKGGKQA